MNLLCFRNNWPFAICAAAYLLQVDGRTLGKLVLLFFSPYATH
jgi:hypothetical protein